MPRAWRDFKDHHLSYDVGSSLINVYSVGYNYFFSLLFLLSFILLPIQTYRKNTDKNMDVADKNVYFEDRKKIRDLDFKEIFLVIQSSEDYGLEFRVFNK